MTRRINCLLLAAVSVFAGSCNERAFESDGSGGSSESKVGSIRFTTSQPELGRLIVQLDCGDVEIWDSRNAKQIAILKRRGEGSRICHVRLSPDSNLLLLVDSNHYPHSDNHEICMAQLWDVKMARCLRNVNLCKIPEIGGGYSDARIHWLQNNVALVQTNFRRNDFAPYKVLLSLFDCTKGEFTKHLVSDLLGEVITLSPDKKSAFSRNLYGASITETGGPSVGGFGRTYSIAIINLESFSVSRSFHASTLAGRDATFLSAFWIQCDSIGLVGSNHCIYTSSINNGGQCSKLGCHDDYVVHVNFNETAHTIYSCSADKSLKVWNLNEGKCVATYAGLPSFPSCSFITAKDQLLVSTAKGDVLLFKGTKPEYLLKGTGKPITRLKAIPGGRDAVEICYADKSVAALSLQEKKIVGTIPATDSISVFDDCVIEKHADKTYQVWPLADVLSNRRVP